MNVTHPESKRNIRVASTIRLRVDVFEAKCAEIDPKATTGVARAALVDCTRENLARIYNGQTPSLELAMHMAERLGTPVEELFEVES